MSRKEKQVHERKYGHVLGEVDDTELRCIKKTKCFLSSQEGVIQKKEENTKEWVNQKFAKTNYTGPRYEKNNK